MRYLLILLSIQLNLIGFKASAVEETPTNLEGKYILLSATNDSNRCKANAKFIYETKTNAAYFVSTGEFAMDHFFNINEGPKIGQVCYPNSCYDAYTSNVLYQRNTLTGIWFDKELRIETRYRLEGDLLYMSKNSDHPGYVFSCVYKRTQLN